MKTPYFLISKQQLNENLSNFQNALDTLWPNSQIAYSVKTNSLPWLLQYLKKHDVVAEVVSDEEYQLARLCGYSDNQIVFNGPIKGEVCFANAIKGKAIINLDSSRDILYLKKYKGENSKNIGIRVNINPDIFDSNDIGYKEDGFRFGFSEENGDFEKVLKCIYNIYGDCRIGLHLHCNTVTRSIKAYIAIAHYAVNLIKKFGLHLSYIDMGGGYFGGVEGKPTAFEYISAIKQELIAVINPQKTKLIVEPGSAIIGSVADLYTSVLDVKETAKTRIVTTDGSRIHIDPLWGKSKYNYSIEFNKNIDNKIGKQIICGYTCMDHDRIMSLENVQQLNVGDKIIYHRVGAYSMTFGGMFIRYLPDVYVQNNKDILKIRKRISVEDYFKIYSLRN